jgi:hypothetical protein
MRGKAQWVQENELRTANLRYISGYILHRWLMEILTNVAINQGINPTARVIIDNNIYAVGLIENVHPGYRISPFREYETFGNSASIKCIRKLQYKHKVK